MFEEFVVFDTNLHRVSEKYNNKNNKIYLLINYFEKNGITSSVPKDELRTITQTKSLSQFSDWSKGKNDKSFVKILCGSGNERYLNPEIISYLNLK
jgi:hypothetical protein